MGDVEQSARVREQLSHHVVIITHSSCHTLTSHALLHLSFPLFIDCRKNHKHTHMYMYMYISMQTHAPSQLTLPLPCPDRTPYPPSMLSGVDPAARREVWKHLLHVYPPGSTSSSRAALRQQQQTDYAALKAQWTTSSSSSGSSSARKRHTDQQQQQDQLQQQCKEMPATDSDRKQQQQGPSPWRQWRGHIDRDVLRTDRWGVSVCVCM